MKIVLINPPYLFPTKSQVVLSHCLGLRSISSFLKKHGHEVKFVDALISGFSQMQKYANGYLVGLRFNDISTEIPSDTDIVGVSVPFSQLAPIAHDLVETIRMNHPDTAIIMGGVYPSTQPELALTSMADHIVVGEGESPLLALANGVDSNSITGLYNTKTKAVKNFLRSEFVEDLNSLPFPDYSIPYIEEYFNLSPRMKAGRTASIVTSRGCPFACEFCSIHPVYGRKYRFRSADNVLEEIEYLVKRHNIRVLEIEDDNFTLKKDRTVEILEGIVRLNEKGANLQWRTPNGIRIDSLDD
jgi:anaerobic magnesium-protoporphyrin IX monomethyl ester cyclase